MDERVKKLIDMVLVHEGGWSNNPNDAGKATYRGITKKNFPNWKGWPIVDAHQPLKWNQIIKDERLETYVREFYYEHFYLKMKIDQLTNECIAGHVFCHGVNAGITKAVKLLQEAISIVYGVSITVDGKIGPQTIRYANGVRQQEVAEKLIELRNKHYKGIAASKPSQKTFLDGWLNRVKGTTKVCCGQSKSTFLTSFINGESIWTKILSIIFQIIRNIKN